MTDKNLVALKSILKQDKCPCDQLKVIFDECPNDTDRKPKINQWIMQTLYDMNEGNDQGALNHEDRSLPYKAIANEWLKETTT